MSIPFVVSSPVYIEDDSDIMYDILEFTDEGCFIIPHNQTVMVNTLIAERANEDVPQFVFTTVLPMKNGIGTKAEVLESVQAAKLVIKELQGNLTVHNVGAAGVSGGRGGDGIAGEDAPSGAINGCGGCGGSGGNGGRGGDGGDGPNVMIEYASGRGSGVKAVRLRAPGGEGGTGGSGGPGGKNADGTPAGCGAPGIKGEKGGPGGRGKVIINGKEVTEEEEGHDEAGII